MVAVVVAGDTSSGPARTWSAKTWSALSYTSAKMWFHQAFEVPESACAVQARAMPSLACAVQAREMLSICLRGPGSRDDSEGQTEEVDARPSVDGRGAPRGQTYRSAPGPGSAVPFRTSVKVMSMTRQTKTFS